MNEKNTERINKLRKEALNFSIDLSPFHFHFFTKYKELKDSDRNECYREAYQYAFSQIPTEISDGELIVGKYPSPLSSEDDEYYKSNLLPFAEEIFAHTMQGQDSHMAIDYELLLTEGIDGILKRIENKEKTADEKGKEFLKNAKACLNAVIEFSKRYSQKAKELSKECPDSKRKAELLKIAEVCQSVPKNPAKSFYEAVQSAHFVTFCLSLNPFRRNNQQFQLGHPDRYLYRFYKEDIEKGVLDADTAQLIADCLCMQINNRVHHGLSSGYLLGGRDEKGELVANELTMIFMQSIDNVRLVYPAVGLCYTKEMSDEYLKKACEILSHGRSHPAIFNDDIITAGLMHYGMPEKEAHNYIHSTCVEITPVASSNVWVASPYTNMIDVLFSCMDKEYDSFDALIDAIKKELDGRIESNYNAEKEKRRIRHDGSINPLLSCFVNDCIEKCTDIEQGGARYNWIMPSFVGLANLVDSLHTIRTLVFEEKKYTITALKKICDEDYENNPELLTYINEKLAKYGNDEDSVDSLFEIFVNHITSTCEKLSKGNSDTLIPSAFCWVMHERLGRETNASPDGRRKGFPLGDGSGPCQGRERKGPTASVLSSTKWSHKELIGGVAVNMKFSKKNFTPDSVNNIIALVKTYISRGGFELQINVTDKETLEKAQKTPEMYKDLVVRIGGYSDYFVTLSPEMQQEVIARSEHVI